jgi:hypothetical protein
MSAYALLQDWDGFFIYSMGGGNEGQWEADEIHRFFTITNDPVKMTETALGALVFLRGDVQAAEELVGRRLTHEHVLEALRRRPDDEHPFAIPDLLGRLALVQRTAITDFRADDVWPHADDIDLPTGREIVSATGELTWVEDPGESHVLTDTPRYQAITGWMKAPQETTHLAVDIDTPFAAIQLASLTNEPVAQSDHLLLLTTARVTNTDMEWKDDARTSVGHNWGHAPTRIEPVVGRVTLRGIHDAQSISLWTLDAQGQRVGEARAFARDGDDWRVDLGDAPATLWYLVEVVR